MSRYIKLRAWDAFNKRWLYNLLYRIDGEGSDLGSYELVQYTGLKDKNNEEWYHEDIGEFENGDRFVIKSEEWVEYFVEWIGEPKCEDQARNFYRISNAKKIGNSFENHELLEEK